MKKMVRMTATIEAARREADITATGAEQRGNFPAPPSPVTIPVTLPASIRRTLDEIKASPNPETAYGRSPAQEALPAVRALNPNMDVPYAPPIGSARRLGGYTRDQISALACAFISCTMKDPHEMTGPEIDEAIREFMRKHRRIDRRLAEAELVLDAAYYVIRQAEQDKPPTRDEMLVRALEKSEWMP